MSVLLSTAYLPPVEWFQHVLEHSSVRIEKHESWQKQSYRNRCYIMGANGKQMLNIPVDGNSKKMTIGNVKISYEQNWQHTHWQAIQSAYGASPFFEILGPELQEFYSKKEEYLFDWNAQMIQLMFDWLQVDIQLIPTNTWQAEAENDFRETIHPKKPMTTECKRYPQVFDDSLGFIPNLSIIDLLFNEGPAAYDFLIT